MIERLTVDGLDYVLRNLRPGDEEEFRATVFRGSYTMACEQIAVLPGLGWMARQEGHMPAVVGGFVPVWPGLCSGWMFGTEAWPQVALEVTKYICRTILPTLDAQGYHRIECRPIAGNAAVIRWLELIGFHQEAVVAQFGQGREDFLLFARTLGYAAHHKRPPESQFQAGHA
jgi:hypothetical protein